MAKEIASGIYKIENTVNGKLYVGSAANFSTRRATHRNMLRAGIHHSLKLQRAWNKYGEASFQFSLIEDVVNATDLIVREQYWMDVLDVVRNGYNVAPLAGSCLGVKYSPETKLKQSMQRKGRKHSAATRQQMSIARKGRVFSDEHKAKLSAAAKGKVIPLELRLRWSLAKKGKRLSQATRDKLSAARKGIAFSPEHRAALSIAARSRPPLQWSDESRAKSAASHRGKKRDPAIYMKMSATKARLRAEREQQQTAECGLFNGTHP